MPFDADGFLAARERWSLTLGGRTYEARPVSVLQVLQFQQAIDLAQNDAGRQRVALALLLRQMFPPRWRYLLGGDPVHRILALDEEARGAILADFFAYLARILTKRTTTRPSPPSSEPTPPNRFEDAASDATGAPV